LLIDIEKLNEEEDEKYKDKNLPELGGESEITSDEIKK